MGKKELATLIDAYADAKASGNKYLAQVMIAQLEQALNQVFGPDAGGEGVVESDGPNADGEY
jgi:hypothetical protein